MLRLESLRRWQIESLSIPLTLFRSEELSELPDYGWAALCNQLTMVPVPGSHLTLLRQTHVLCPRLLAAIDQAVTNNATTRVAREEAIKSLSH